MYSWSETFTGGNPTFGAGEIAAMAAQGVQTLYIQAASQTGPAAVLEPGRLVPLIDQAHRAGISVVAWYLPSLVDPADDLACLLAISRLPVDAIALDLESTNVVDIGARNAALLSLSQELRRALPTKRLGAIVLPATLLKVVNTNFWPDFPYARLAPTYDAWLPMVYWTKRLASSGFDNGYAYTTDSVHRLREDLGPKLGPVAKIAPLGGVSVDGIAMSDVAGFVKAAEDTGSVGGSIYEWLGTDPVAWPTLRALRSSARAEVTRRSAGWGRGTAATRDRSSR